MAANGEAGFDDNADFVPLSKAPKGKPPAAAPGHRREKKKKPRKALDGPMKRRSLFVTGLPEDATNEMVRPSHCSACFS